MNIHELPRAWREAESRLRALAATYPKEHTIQVCLMGQVGALDLCARNLEEALAEAGGLLIPAKLSSAIEAVEVGLQVTRRELPPSKKAALVLAAYKLLNDEGESTRAEQAARR